MFTVKFYKHYENGESSQASFSCQSYDIYRRKNGSHEISIYSDPLRAHEGISINVSQEPEHYQQCYVENMAGKTIDTIRA